MPIDLDRVSGADLAAGPFSWVERDVILYNLGVGAGDPPTEARELAYTYEGDLKAVPTFGTNPAFPVMMGVGAIDGLDISLAQILHGEHELTVHRPIPTSGTVTQSGRIADVYDKGKGALMVLEVVSSLDSTGEALFTNRAGIFVRGEGGFGGEPGPKRDTTEPVGDPDLVVESRTLPQQALLFRQASGDLNPLHADPGFAAFASYPQPILHGLCTYGIVAKAVVDSVLDGDTERFRGFRARFTGQVFPGETVVTSIWADEEGCTVEATTAERRAPVLGNGRIDFG